MANWRTIVEKKLMLYASFSFMMYMVYTYFYLKKKNVIGPRQCPQQNAANATPHTCVAVATTPTNYLLLQSVVSRSLLLYLLPEICFISVLNHCPNTTYSGVCKAGSG